MTTKFKMSVTSAIKKYPSDTSNICRVKILATDVFETLLSEVKKADFMSIFLTAWNQGCHPGCGLLWMGR